ncbi:MAG TPA: hypothetical protein DCQ31_15510 [Bacteroidales bacterium]|nr:hypothetical protein [Bacteroidales bacterium]
MYYPLLCEKFFDITYFILQKVHFQLFFKYEIVDHFAQSGKIVDSGATSNSGSDYKFSCFACYLIVQNDLPRKARCVKQLTILKRFFNFYFV